LESDWGEECGVVGIYNGENSVEQAGMGLHALQHRGQESSGIAVSDGKIISTFLTFKAFHGK